MNKAAIVESLLSQLRKQYERSVAALQSAHEAATGDDTKAESKYDTRGLEASYLAAGQAEQADELARAVAAVENFEFRDFDFDDEIETGALVECDVEDDLVYFLLSPGGGGIVCEETETGESITVLGPESPLTEKLLGKKSGQGSDGLLILEVF